MCRKFCTNLNAHEHRIIEYFVCGSERKDARILVYCHGANGTGKMFSSFPKWVQKVKDLNVKVIAVTQPGCGYSSIHIGRHIGNWPRDDLQPVLVAEGVGGKFTVSGISLGAPHALAVAHYFGAARVSGMGLQVPFVSMPFSEDLGLVEGMSHTGYTSTDYNTSVVGNLIARFVLFTESGKPGDQLRQPPGTDPSPNPNPNPSSTLQP